MENRTGSRETRTKELGNLGQFSLALSFGFLVCGVRGLGDCQLTVHAVEQRPTVLAEEACLLLGEISK